MRTVVDPIRAAAERLLEQLKLPSGTPYAGQLLEQAESDLRAALAAEPPAPAVPDEVREAFAELERRQEKLHRFRDLRVALAWEPPAPAEPADFQTLQGIALDMVESLRPVVIPEIVAVLRKAIESTAQTAPAPAPAADGEREEREELAQWLYCLADERSCNRRRGIRPHPSALRRAAALLREARPQPVPVADRPWKRPGWCDAEGRCWFGAPVAGAADAGWILRKPPLRISHQTASLPHWAIPQPPQGGEVEP